MSDIVDRLRNPPFRHAGTAAPVLDERVVLRTMCEAADEIDRLRGIAGCCSDGPSLSDIRKDVSV